MTIWKFPLEVTDEQIVRMPAGSTILAVQVQQGTPCLWAKVDPESEQYDRRIFIHGTGHALHPDANFHLGTFQLLDGRFVGHVFSVLP